MWRWRGDWGALTVVPLPWLQLYRCMSDRAPSSHQVTRNMVLDKIEHERDRLRLERQRLHNQNFGSIFVSTTSPTLFAFSLMVGWHCDC